MIRNLIRKGTISKIYNQEGIIRAQVIILNPEDPEDVVLWLPYGHNACPPIGSQVIVQAVFGNLEDKFAFPANIEGAPVLNIGESILYDNFGSKVYLKENGDIEITAKANVEITATNTTINGNAHVTGTLVVDGNSTLTGSGTSIAGKTFLTHTHTGVTSGSDNSGGVTP